MKPRILIPLVLALVNLGARPWTMKSPQESGLTNEMQGAPKNAPAYEGKPNKIFGGLVPELLRETRVPLRLPEYVPNSDDKETPLYSILEVAEPERYSIQLAWIKDCTGGNACHVGYIGGSKAPFPHEDKPEVLVTLKGGLKGLLVGFDCGAHCDDASINWAEGGYYYGISLKAGDKKTLIRMANSAIASGDKAKSD